MRSAAGHLEEAGYTFLDQGMGGELTLLIRKVQIDALKWAFEFEGDPMVEIIDKIAELEAAK